MDILYSLFFFGLAMSLVVAKGIFMSQDFAAKSRQERKAKGQKQRHDANEAD